MKNYKTKDKAMSVVIASVILLAVAFAVSIATAGWLSNISIRHTETEEVRIVNVSFGFQNATLDFWNLGSTDVVITEIRVGSSDDLLDTDLVVKWSSSANATIALDWVPGSHYQFSAKSVRGNVFIYDAYV